MASSVIQSTFLALTFCVSAGCETVYHAVAGPGRNSTDSTPAADAGGDSSADLAGRTAMLPTCDGASGCVSVLTYNLKHRDVPLQLEAVAQSLKTTCPRLPDFILLQEVMFNRPTRKGLNSTAEELASRIGYQSRGEARDGGDEGIAILSRIPFEHYDHVHLQARDALLSGGFPRVSVMGEFRVPGAGLVRIVNVHLTQRVSQVDIRTAQLRETLEWMAARQREVAADVVVLGGDFNFEPGAPEHELLRDSAANFGIDFADHNSTTATSGKIGDPYSRVDYIFIASPTKAVSSVGEGVLWRDGIPTIDGSTSFWPSDHLPLLHVFAVAPK